MRAQWVGGPQDGAWIDILDGTTEVITSDGPGTSIEAAHVDPTKVETEGIRWNVIRMSDGTARLRQINESEKS